jgi:hypothetical protein
VTSGEPRFHDTNGKPNFAEYAHAALMRAHASPQRDEAKQWFQAAMVNAMLAQLEGQQDLARSNRELAAAMNRLADLRERQRDG